MRIIRFQSQDGRVLHGVECGDGAATVLRGSVTEGFVRTQDRASIVKLLAPIVPTDIICIGRNYPGMQQNQPDWDRDDSTLEVFLKPSTSLLHPGDSVFVPHFGNHNPQLDCEGELAVVISRDMRTVPETQALEFVFGYTIANDLTARIFQTASGPPLWMRGKGFDGFCPLGPAIITREEIADPQSLAIRTRIDGQVVREGNTRDMLRSVQQIIATLSRHMTLRAGSVILTGAPAASTSSITLKPGSQVEVEIEKIGVLAHAIGRHVG
jgi:2-keto-4-pentenoate hydratase/2-oxohepta-3-ene-1,7-dioic acid hydratase in catechol pathway